MICLNVLYDYQIFWYQNYGGISRYYAGLMDFAYEKKLFDFKSATLFSNNRFINGKPYSKSVPFPKLLVNGRNVLTFWPNKLNRANTMRLLNTGKFDLFHPTYFQDYFVNKIKVPFVINFFDLIMEKFPEFFVEGVKFSAEKKNLLSSASMFIAASNNTKKDLIDQFGVESDKIGVAYLATHILPHSVVNETRLAGVPNEYILFVGSRSRYKNFDFFLKSVSPILKDNPKLYVVCAGDPFSEAELKYFDELGVKNRVIIYKVNDDDLIYLYGHAKLFVFPSAYEGFGIPLLESFNCGCPMAISNASCFPEVVGDAAAYFDPLDEVSMRETISNVLFDEKMRALLVERGFERTKAFSLENTALQTKAIYEKVLE